MLYDTTTKFNSYFKRAFQDVEVLAEELVVALNAAGVSYDTLIGTGLSGTIVVPTMARLLNVPAWAIVRKELSPHSSNEIEGSVGWRWLFVDDFVSSGATRDRVKAAIARAVPATTYVGTYSYEWKTFSAR
jgi:orotate phosphoribosyltransferase